LSCLSALACFSHRTIQIVPVARDFDGVAGV